jgi:hypothetical protein
MKATGRTFPLGAVTPSPTFILLEIRPDYLYENGKPTNKLVGYRYKVGDPQLFEQFTVKVAQPAPLMTNEELSNATAMVYVRFINATARIYQNKGTGSLEFAFQADDVQLIGATQ